MILVTVVAVEISTSFFSSYTKLEKQEILFIYSISLVKRITYSTRHYLYHYYEPKDEWGHTLARINKFSRLNVNQTLYLFLLSSIFLVLTRHVPYFFSSKKKTQVSLFLSVGYLLSLPENSKNCFACPFLLG